MELRLESQEDRSTLSLRDKEKAKPLWFGWQRCDADTVRLVMGVTLIAVALAVIITKAPGLQTAESVNSMNVSQLEKVGLVPEEPVRAAYYNAPWENAGDKDLARQPDAYSSVRALSFTSEEGESSHKHRFFEELMPQALLALSEVALERRFLIELLEQLQTIQAAESFSRESMQFAKVEKYLSKGDREQLRIIAKKYRTTDLVELFKRVDVVPPSLLLAQAALESSWGKSRFAVHGNNYFGIWTWRGPGLVPSRRDAGKTHKVAIYDSILDSIRAYLLILNRVPAYREFRKARLESMDSLVLAQGLTPYSERGEAYVSEVKGMIEGNRLQRFD